MLRILLLFSFLTVVGPQEAPQAPALARAVAADATGKGTIALLDGEPITRVDFDRHLAARYRNSSEGQAALSQIIDNRLVEREMKKRGIVVAAAEVDKRFQELEGRVSESGAKTTLSEQLSERGVSPEEFRERLVLLIGLEKMARQDFRLAENAELPTAKQGLWLKDLREKAKIETPSGPAAAAACATIDGENVPSEVLGQEIEKALPAQRLRELLREIIGIRATDRLCAAAGITVSADDLAGEIAHRKKAFESDPRFQGASYDDYLKATAGGDSATLKDDPSFKAQVALKKAYLQKFGRDAVKKRFDDRQDVYGPRVHVQHILIRANDQPLPPPLGDGKIHRTFAEAEEIAKKAVAELRQGAGWKSTVEKYSEDTTRMSEGDIGFIPESNRCGVEFYKAANALPAGEFSEPVRSPYGWHVLTTKERKPAPPFDDAYEKVLTDLAAELYRDSMKAAKIEYLPGAPGGADDEAEKPPAGAPSPGAGAGAESDPSRRSEK